MALTRTEQQILWSSATSITISDANVHDADAVIFDAADVSASIQVSADNAGTPAAGDILIARIKWTTGDVLTGGGDDYDTSEHAQLLVVLNTVIGETPGEDPAIRTVDIPTSAKGFKLSVLAPQGGARNIVVKARLATQRSA